MTAPSFVVYLSITGPKFPLLPFLPSPRREVKSFLVNKGIDNPANLEGAPTTIQIITTTMRDEECLEIAKLIDTYVKAESRNGANASKL